MFVRVNGKKVTGIANNPEALGNKNVFEVDDLPEFTELDELMWDGKRVVLDPDYTPPPDPVPVDARVEKLETQVKILAKKLDGQALSETETSIFEEVKK